MVESDLRVANTRLQSGGEVNPFTARHMGLFVVGRLATQHGLVVRLRSTIAGQPDSGTTAGIYVKAELLARGTPPVEHAFPSYDIPDDPYGETANGLAFAEDPTDYEVDDATYDDEPYEERRVGRLDVPVSLLPQRNPGSSGIAGIPIAFSDHDDEGDDDPIPERTADVLRPAVWQAQEQEDQPSEPVAEAPAPLPVRQTNGARPPVLPVLPMRSRDFTAEQPLPERPAEVSAWDEPVLEPAPEVSAWDEPVVEPAPDVSAFGGEQVVERPAAPAASAWSEEIGEGHRPEPVGAAWSDEQEDEPAPEVSAFGGEQVVEGPPQPEEPERPERPEPAAAESNSIFDKMLSEWLIDDPVELAHSADLDWKTVWDHGWSVASAADEKPVSQRTESGLPVRDPGARLVPGAAESADAVNGDATNERHGNGGAPNGNGNGHNGDAHNGDHNGDESRHGAHRDPEAVRASISSHFGGVHAGRANAREAKGTEEE
jgi:hypothetical protein